MRTAARSWLRPYSPGESGREREEEHEAPPLLGVIGLIAGILMLGVLVLAIEPLRSGIGDALSGDTEDLRGTCGA